jgi:hypothetical protein
LIAQPVNAGFSDQLRSFPAPAGKVSLTVTPLAVPVPLLSTVMSKPIVLPAATGPVGFAVFVIAMSAHCTSTESEDLSEPSLSVLTEASFDTVPQSAFVVDDSM